MATLMVTPDSIARAKAAQQRERAEVTRVTGLTVTDHGVLHPPFIIHCPRPGCVYKAVAKREWQAVRSLGAHIIRIHLEQGK